MNWAIWFNGFCWGWAAGCIAATIICNVIFWLMCRRKKKP
jgi:hypothetical protein